MDTTICCQNCSEPIVRIIEEDTGNKSIETQKAYQSLQAFENRLFLRCGICGFSGTSIPDSLIGWFDEQLKNKSDDNDQES
jgi:hypothetical protein